jgi:hypothetical protein
MYTSPNIIEMIESDIREKRTAYRVLLGKQEGKKPLRRP